MVWNHSRKQWVSGDDAKEISRTRARRSLSARLGIEAVDYGEVQGPFNDWNDRPSIEECWAHHAGSPVKDGFFWGMVMVHLLSPPTHTHTSVLCTSLSCQVTTMAFTAQATTGRGLPMEGMDKRLWSIRGKDTLLYMFPQFLMPPHILTSVWTPLWLSNY